MTDSPEIESQADHGPTPEGRQERWDLEIASAKKNQEQFWADGDKVVKEFLGEGGKNRLNLLHADVQTKAANLSGDPKIRARRRHADALDDDARVSATALERLLNTDVERDSDGFRRSLHMAKMDWLRSGLGQVRFRYVMEEGAEGIKAFEDVETDFVNWKDFLWSPCRTWDEIRWIAYGADMSRDALHRRFDEVLGADLVATIPVGSPDKDKDDRGTGDLWKRVRVWEVWDKEAREVVWVVEGFTRVLDVKPDPLGLPNFFPSPQPLASNLTSSKFIPRAPYFLAEDLYEEANRLTKRIRELVKTVKVVGAYAAGNDAIKQILDEACENTLVPVSDLASLLGKDGVAGAAWIMPIEPQVKALAELVIQRNLVKREIYEITGQSDIMRGQAAEKATATEQRIKARFGSTRIQAEQDEFARFATDAQRIRAFIICKHFDPVTIVQRSNIDKAEEDQALVARAVQLLKSDFASYRIDVDSESLTMTDFDAVQQDGIAIMTATAEFFKNFAPLMADPAIGSFVLELYQQFISGFRGSQRFESIIDRGIAQLKQAAAQPKPPPPPDPKVEGAKIDLAAKQIDARAKAQQAQAAMQKTVMDAQVDQASFGMRMAEIQAKRAAAADVEPAGGEA